MYRQEFGSTMGIWLIDIEVAIRGCGVVPGRLDIQSGQDRPVISQPIAPGVQRVIRWRRAEVEVAGDSQLRCQRVERLFRALVKPLGRKRQNGIRHRAEFAADIQRRFEPGAGALDDRGRIIVELIGFLGGHPGEARRKLLRFR